MHLKNIKLAGFKSFVDPTTVPLTKNLIAVVGPNGCGKSNIVDAIRWVMGESSAKTLRGESMADVIFNGSTSRNPVGQASVQLTFDNADGSIGGEYVDYAEISIKRVASREGTSTYYLNNTKCRRKDITDVFLGTGLGPRSYSVIEQGMISRFIEAKPDDLRMYIEEAAGISKYKERRRDTETRIRHTRENLDRVEDLRNEIGKQLEKLQRQAKAAERYKVLKQDERLNKAQLYVLQWQLLNDQMQDFTRLIQEAELAIEERVTEQRSISTQIEHLRESQIESSDTLNTVQGRYYALGSEIAKIEQSITHHQERYQQLQEDMQRMEASTSELQNNMQEDQRHLIELRQEFSEVEPQLDSAKEKVTLSSASLQQGEANVQAWREEWEAFSQEASKTLRTAEVEQTRIKHAQQNIGELSSRIDRLTEEQQQLDFSELKLELENLQQTKLEREEKVSFVREQLEQAKLDMTALRAERDVVTQQWDANKETLQQAKGRFSSLTALQQAALGENDRSITAWLEKNELQSKPRLVQSMTVQTGWERAVETVLGSHLEAICVDDFNAAQALLGDTPDGQFEFFMADGVSSSTSSNAQTLSSKVECELPVNHLLDSVYCAENLTQAKEIAANLQAHESVVCQDGIWLGKSWLRIAKDKDAQVGILQRENQLTELTAQIETLSVEVNDLQTKFELSKQNLVQFEQTRDELQQQFNQDNQSLSQARAEFQVQQEKLQRGTTRLERISHELSDQQNKLQQAQSTLDAANMVWQEALSSSETNATRKIELENLGEQYKEHFSQTRDQARLDNEHSHKIELRVGQLKPQIETLQASIDRAEQQLQVMFERSAMLAESLGEGEGPVVELQEKLAEILAQRVSVEHELQAVRQQVETVTQEMRNAEEKKESIGVQIEQMRRSLEEKRLEGRTVDVRKNTIEEQIVELDFELAVVIQELPEDADLQAWQDEAEKISVRISRLGAINLAAIDEYKVQLERKEYLDSQNADLIEAVTTLENAIAKIDKETRGLFKETFDRVNDGFKKLFPKVFGGGSAHLELTGDDLLNTGISVMARPPGKRNTSIHLLSGGEKALTAVSLVFAIFELNPAPFCLLDEVDAPLDDANVERFCTLVKEMSKTVQFLFISHNKIAIEMAEQLTGVTMYEPGVSRIVAVDMEEAVKMAAA
jgi:chromosome segregation protein